MTQAGAACAPGTSAGGFSGGMGVLGGKGTIDELVETNWTEIIFFLVYFLLPVVHSLGLLPFIEAEKSRRALPGSFAPTK